MGSMPDPNVMRAPAIAEAFANRMQSVANQDRQASLTLERDQRMPGLNAAQRRMQYDADVDYQRDPMSLANQKTQGILSREQMRQDGQNERTLTRRYGTKGSPSRAAVDIISYAQSKGLSPAQAAALAAHMQSESGFNMRAVGDNGTAHYGFQFRNDRKSGIENYARQNGLSLDDPKTSVDYLIKEMQSVEANKGGNDFFAATTPDAASSALSRVIRHSTKGAHASETGKRIALTNQMMKLANEGNKQSQTNAFGVGEGVEPDGRKYKSAFMPNYQADALRAQGYMIEVDPTSQQNNKGMFPYKIYDKKSPIVPQKTPNSAVTTQQEPMIAANKPKANPLPLEDEEENMEDEV